MVNISIFQPFVLRRYFAFAVLQKGFGKQRFLYRSRKGEGRLTVCGDCAEILSVVFRHVHIQHISFNSHALWRNHIAEIAENDGLTRAHKQSSQSQYCRFQKQRNNLQNPVSLGFDGCRNKCVEFVLCGQNFDLALRLDCTCLNAFKGKRRKYNPHKRYKIAHRFEG